MRSPSRQICQVDFVQVYVCRLVHKLAATSLKVLYQQGGRETRELTGEAGFSPSRYGLQRGGVYAGLQGCHTSAPNIIG